MKGLDSKKKSRLIFYICGVAWPVIQFIVFYVFVNFNSILLSFRNFDIQSGYSFAGTDNFKRVFSEIATQPFLKTAFKNTFLIFGISIVGMFATLIMSYYLYKKHLFSGIFKVMLFLPSIIPGIALVICYKYFVEVGVPKIWEEVFNISIQGLLSNPDTKLITILFFNVWFGIGSTFLLYSGAMSGISDSIIEAATLDGVTAMQEFGYIVFPMIFPTFATFFITSFATLFTNQMSVFSFSGAQADYSVYTIGYYLYKSVQTATMDQYPYLSAFGLVLTVIIIPICLLTKKALDKFGPKTI